MTGKHNIVWLASYPKSGNTWFRAFLSNFLSNQYHPQNINEIDISNIASSRSLFDDFSGINSSDLSATEIDNFRPDIYRQYSKQSLNTLYIKAHDAWTLNAKGEPLFPKDVTRGVIYIIRHPLDVAVSLSFHNTENIARTLKSMNSDSYGLCLKPDKLHNQLCQKLLTWSNHVDSWVFKSGLNVHTIRYEDMKRTPFQTFSHALRFLDISYSKNDLKTAINNSTFEALSEQEQIEGFKEKPIKAEAFFRKGIMRDWVNHIDLKTAQQFIIDNELIFSKFYPEEFDSV